MYISKKIDEIRNKPEHIRERYLWMIGAFCMLFIFGVWLLSFKSSFRQAEEEKAVSPVKDLVDKSKESINEIPGIEGLSKTK